MQLFIIMEVRMENSKEAVVNELEREILVIGGSTSAIAPGAAQPGGSWVAPAKLGPSPAS